MKLSSIIPTVLVLGTVYAAPQGERREASEMSREKTSATQPDSLRDLRIAMNGDKLEQFFCSYDTAQVTRIRDGLNHLHKHKKSCGVPAGKTMRVSCSYNSAIYVYNSDIKELNVNCAEIADVANELLTQCEWYDPGYPAEVGGRITPTWIGGKIPTSDNYIVEIRHDYC